MKTKQVPCVNCAVNCLNGSFVGWNTQMTDFYCLISEGQKGHFNNIFKSFWFTDLIIDDRAVVFNPLLNVFQPKTQQEICFAFIISLALHHPPEQFLFVPQFVFHSQNKCIRNIHLHELIGCSHPFISQFFTRPFFFSSYCATSIANPSIEPIFVHKISSRNNSAACVSNSVLHFMPGKMFKHFSCETKTEKKSKKKKEKRQPKEMILIASRSYFKTTNIKTMSHLGMERRFAIVKMEYSANGFGPFLLRIPRLVRCTEIPRIYGWKGGTGSELAHGWGKRRQMELVTQPRNGFECRKMDVVRSYSTVYNCFAGSLAPYRPRPPLHSYTRRWSHEMYLFLNQLVFFFPSRSCCCCYCCIFFRDLCSCSRPEPIGHACLDPALNLVKLNYSFGNLNKFIWIVSFVFTFDCVVEAREPRRFSSRSTEPIDGGCHIIESYTTCSTYFYVFIITLCFSIVFRCACCSAISESASCCL